MKLPFCAAFATLAIVLTSTLSAQTGQTCDRACRLDISDAYFAALAAHDPSKAPMAPNAKFTEQAQGLKVGEGLWKTTTEGPTTFKIPVPDPVTGQIGVIAMISGGKIHEIEAMGFTLPLYSKNGWSPFVR
jgi:hypothetical protein